MLEKINLEEQMAKISEPWTPIDLVLLNDQVIRMAMCHGEFHWHKHNNEDEMFYILKGELTIQIKDAPDMVLSEGEMVRIPKGVEHCPKCTEPAYTLTFEPFLTKSKGD